MSTFGEDLKRERELRKISLREVSEATKISLRFLDALERNEFSDLPGGVFNKGYVRAYAQYIGVDPEAMVNSYLLEERSQIDRGVPSDVELLRGSPGAGPPKLAEGDASGHARLLSPAHLLLAAAVLAIALAGLGYLWFVRGTAAEETVPAGSAAGEATHRRAATPAPVPPAAGAPIVREEPPAGDVEPAPADGVATDPDGGGRS